VPAITDQYAGAQAGLYFLACLREAVAKKFLEDWILQ
jgi:hypothetical protein